VSTLPTGPSIARPDDGAGYCRHPLLHTQVLQGHAVHVCTFADPQRKVVYAELWREVPDAI
jgi:hypothetical protein